jgi:hypothetical protein
MDKHVTSDVTSENVIRLLREGTIGNFDAYLAEKQPFVVVDSRGNEQFIPPLNTDIRFGPATKRDDLPFKKRFSKTS